MGAEQSNYPSEGITDTFTRLSDKCFLINSNGRSRVLVDENCYCAHFISILRRSKDTFCARYQISAESYDPEFFPPMNSNENINNPKYTNKKTDDPVSTPDEVAPYTSSSVGSSSSSIVSNATQSTYSMGIGAFKGVVNGLRSLETAYEVQYTLPHETNNPTAWINSGTEMTTNSHNDSSLNRDIEEGNQSKNSASLPDSTWYEITVDEYHFYEFFIRHSLENKWIKQLCTQIIIDNIFNWQRSFQLPYQINRYIENNRSRTDSGDTTVTVNGDDDDKNNTTNHKENMKSQRNSHLDVPIASHIKYMFSDTNDNGKDNLDLLSAFISMYLILDRIDTSVTSVIPHLGKDDSKELYNNIATIRRILHADHK